MILSQSALANEQSQAVEKLGSALMATEYATSVTLNLEKKINNIVNRYLNLGPLTTPILGVFVVLGNGRVSTNDIQPLKIKVLEKEVEANIQHNLHNQTTQATLQTEWQF